MAAHVPTKNAITTSSGSRRSPSMAPMGTRATSTARIPFEAIISVRRRKRSASTPNTSVNTRNGRYSANLSTPSCAALTFSVSIASRGRATKVT
jgi:hypothetical protein